jgi:hypothetical protein
VVRPGLSARIEQVDFIAGHRIGGHLES